MVAVKRGDVVLIEVRRVVKNLGHLSETDFTKIEIALRAILGL